LEKTFTGELTLTPAESALLCFDRYTELRNNEKEKAKIKKQFKAMDLYNKYNSLALFIDKENVKKVKNFINEYENDLILEDYSEFIWSHRKEESLLFLKDNKKSIEIGSLVLDVEKIDSTIIIQFAPNSTRLLSGFTMKYLNRPILLEINDKLITTVKSFGKLEDGILKIKTN
jgi:hypothetical protein